MTEGLSVAEKFAAMQEQKGEQMDPMDEGDKIIRISISSFPLPREKDRMAWLSIPLTVKEVMDREGTTDALIQAASEKVVAAFGILDKEMANVPAHSAPKPQAASSTPPEGGTASSSPTCPHGTRLYRSGTKKDGEPWAGWFCPLPKEQKAEQCKPEWRSVS